MKFFIKLIFVIIIYFSLIQLNNAQTIIQNRDQKVYEMINEISSQNLEKYVRTLVGFKTRHSL
ncbi:MAG: peptidase M28, partial [Melioribacter sp.]|nr:peptidase M28 [Melioribacter sp.]